MANIGEHGLTRKEAMDAAAQLEAEGFIMYEERIGVIRDPEQEKIGSLYVPDQARNRPLRGTVVMIGAGVSEEFGIYVGDRITFSKYFNILFDLPLMNGEDTVYVEVVHVSDLYIGWRH